MIAQGWAGPEGADRLAEPNDVVRRELELALGVEGVLVIPVLVNRELPQAETLPETLVPLLDRQAVTLRSGRWDDDVVVVIDRIRNWLVGPRPQTGPPVAERAAAPGSERRTLEGLEESLAAAPVSRTPILIALETGDDRLTDLESSRTERHLT